MPILKKTKKNETKPLTVAPPDQLFWVNNGPVLKDLRDLRDAFRTMTDEQYRFHAKRDGNDFAKWVSVVLHNEECAKQLKRATSRLLALEVVGECLAE